MGTVKLLSPSKFQDRFIEQMSSARSMRFSVREAPPTHSTLSEIAKCRFVGASFFDKLIDGSPQIKFLAFNFDDNFRLDATYHLTETAVYESD